MQRGIQKYDVEEKMYAYHSKKQETCEQPPYLEKKEKILNYLIPFCVYILLQLTRMILIGQNEQCYLATQQLGKHLNIHFYLLPLLLILA